MALANHMQKHKKSDLGALQVEDIDREAKTNHENDDLNRSRSCLNYGIEWSPGTLTVVKPKYWKQKVLDRVNELNLKRIRKDATYSCSFVISESKEFFDKLTESQKRLYFVEAVQFYGSRYGYENIASAVVHMDEHTPHMHLRIVPVTKDGRLSAKDIFTPSEMKTLQKAFYGHMRYRGFEVGQPEFGKKKVHLNEIEYKVKQENDKLAMLQNEIRYMQQQRKELNNALNALNAKISDRKDKLGEYEGYMAKMLEFVNNDSRRVTDIAYELSDKIYEVEQMAEQLINPLQAEKAYNYVSDTRKFLNDRVEEVTQIQKMPNKIANEIKRMMHDKESR